MDNRPIGIFDSGFGGLTALRALRELMPGEDIVFFGDNARMPYGVRSERELRFIARQDLDFVASFGVKAMIVACGTMSATAPDIIAGYPVPSVGIVESAARAMGAYSGTLGVIATEASIRSGAFQRAILSQRPEAEVMAIPCPDFVLLTENGRTSKEDSAVREAVRRYLFPMKEAGVRALLLGCTHFGLLSEAIRDYLGEVPLISASKLAAEELCRRLREAGAEGGSGKTVYMTSGSTAEFEQKASLLLREEIHGAVSVPVMEEFKQ